MVTKGASLDCQSPFSMIEIRHQNFHPITSHHIITPTRCLSFPASPSSYGQSWNHRHRHRAERVIVWIVPIHYSAAPTLDELDHASILFHITLLPPASLADHESLIDSEPRSLLALLQTATPSNQLPSPLGFAKMPDLERRDRRQLHTHPARCRLPETNKRACTPFCPCQLGKQKRTWPISLPSNSAMSRVESHLTPTNVENGNHVLEEDSSEDVRA